MLRELHRVLNAVAIWMAFSSVQRKTKKYTLVQPVPKSLLTFREITLPLAYAFCFNTFGYFLVPEKWLAMVLVVVLTISYSSSSQRLNRTLLTKGWPTLCQLEKDMQVSNLKRLINQIVLVMTLIQALCLFDLKFSLILIGVMLVLSLVYLPAKLKKMID